MGGDHKRASERRLDHLRALRSKHEMQRRPTPDEPPADDAVDADASTQPVPTPPVPPPPTAQHAPPRPEPDNVDIAQVKYEMELADHRQTMARLLAEKDQTIDALRELVTELRTQLTHQREQTSPTMSRAEPERTARPADAPRHLFDLTED